MDKFIEYESEKVFYQLNGKGEPLVFLHGFLEDSTIWNDINNELSKKYQVLMIDLPGHGKSSGFSKLKTMTNAAIIIKIILERCKFVKPIVFGHSMGGYVGLELAKLMSINLVLIHSNFWADNLEKRKDRDRVIEVVKKNKDFFISIAIPNLFCKAGENFEREIKLMKKTASKMDSDSIISSTIAMKDRLDNSVILEQQKVAIVQGRYDPIIPHSQMEYQLSKIKNPYDITVIENCGHLGFIEQPAFFLDAIRTIIYKFSSLQSNI